MKTRTLIFLLMILGILAGAGLLANRMMAPKPPKQRMGESLFPKLPVNRISSILIKSPKDTVSLVKGKDRWVVKSRLDYPADFDKITNLVRKLMEVKIGRSFPSSEDSRKRLSLEDPDSADASEERKGIRIRLLGDKELPLANLLLGKIRYQGEQMPLPEGQYVMLDDKPEVFLINRDFSYLETESREWLQKKIVDVKEEEIRKISCRSADGKKVIYTLERAKKGEAFKTVDLPEGRKMKESFLKRMEGVLSPLQLEDVANPSGMEASAFLEFQLFNGIIYRLYPAREKSKDAPLYLTVKVDYLMPREAPEEGKTEKSASVKSREERALEAKNLQERLSPWVYLVPKWEQEAFSTDLEQILERPDEKQEQKEK